MIECVCACVIYFKKKEKEEKKEVDEKIIKKKSARLIFNPLIFTSYFDTFFALVLQLFSF